MYVCISTWMRPGKFSWFSVSGESLNTPVYFRLLKSVCRIYSPSLAPISISLPTTPGSLERKERDSTPSFSFMFLLQFSPTSLSPCFSLSSSGLCILTCYSGEEDATLSSQDLIREERSESACTVSETLGGGEFQPFFVGAKYHLYGRSQMIEISRAGPLAPVGPPHPSQRKTCDFLRDPMHLRRTSLQEHSCLDISHIFPALDEAHWRGKERKQRNWVRKGRHRDRSVIYII